MEEERGHEYFRNFGGSVCSFHVLVITAIPILVSLLGPGDLSEAAYQEIRSAYVKAKRVISPSGPVFGRNTSRTGSDRAATNAPPLRTISAGVVATVVCNDDLDRRIAL